MCNFSLDFNNLEKDATEVILSSLLGVDGFFSSMEACPFARTPAAGQAGKIAKA
jgi:hypothetical protein